MKVEQAIGWGILFLALVAMTDIPATQQVAAGLAVLILISVALTYGPQAATFVTQINKPASTGVGDNTAKGLA